MLNQTKKHFKIPNSADPLKQFKDMLYLSQVKLNRKFNSIEVDIILYIYNDYKNIPSVVYYLYR